MLGKTFIPFIIFILIVFGLCFALKHDPHYIPSPLIHQKVPAFQAESLFNPKKKFSENVFKGQITLLNVFASWCLTCRAEHPVLMDIALKGTSRSTRNFLGVKNKFNCVKRLRNRRAITGDTCLAQSALYHPSKISSIKHRYHIIGIDYKDTRASAIKWIRKYDDPYQHILFDPKGRLAIDLGVYGTPETFLIDQNGYIRYKWVGAMSPRVWQDKFLPRIKRLRHDG